MPRITQAQKAANRERIVTAASEHLRRHGIEAVGIAEVMRSAGMTHGGFYNHFDSKEDLVAVAVEKAFDTSVEFFSHVIETASGSAREAVVQAYLRPEHRDDEHGWCPSASMAVDVARQSPTVQQAYARGMARLVDVLVLAAHRDGVPESAPDSGAEATTLLSAMVGALSMSGAIVRADRAASDDLLRTVARRLAA